MFFLFKRIFKIFTNLRYISKISWQHLEYILLDCYNKSRLLKTYFYLLWKNFDFVRTLFKDFIEEPFLQGILLKIQGILKKALAKTIFHKKSQIWHMNNNFWNDAIRKYSWKSWLYREYKSKLLFEYLLYK